MELAFFLGLCLACGPVEFLLGPRAFKRAIELKAYLLPAFSSIGFAILDPLEHRSIAFACIMVTCCSAAVLMGAFARQVADVMEHT
ncbi:MAG: hypothetical protein Q7T01_02385 [bacterium]|nr:hypothetical protein [bacterium]